MCDNFYLDDLLGSLRKETTVERYWKLIPMKDRLLEYLHGQGAALRDDVTDERLNDLGANYGQETARLLRRFLHLYDFNRAKLREIEDLRGTERYDTLADLLRLPGVRLLRAELYRASGVTLQVLAEKPTEEIRDMMRACVERENRPESVPFPKEVNCHREVAKMILHLRANE